MKKKTLAASIMSIAMCGSLVTGATFALFTSEHKTNVAISSGKVEVVATLENLEVYSPTLIAADASAILDPTNAATNTENKGVFVNGGTAELASPEITLSNMTPGDYATFQIKITNYSTVNTQYRTILKVIDDDGLVNGLEMGIKKSSEEAYADYSGATIYSNWESLSIPAGESEVVELNDCKIELPIAAGNEYQDKSCKFVCVVEAIQANADTNNNVAKIGETNYDSLEAALSAVKEGETVEILRPGTYAPFKLEKKNVTIKGIVGKDKASSTVIKNTENQNIQAYADGITLENLYIDTTTTQSINWVHAGAVDPYINTGSGIIAKDLAIKGCYMVGNGSSRAILYSSNALTFTDNTLENFGVGVYVMNDGLACKGWVIEGNTFKNVAEPVNGYWGGEATETTDTLVIKNNTVDNGGERARIVVWDYAQNEHDYSAFTNVEISGNNGNIVYNLNHFNYKAATKHTVTVGNGTQAIKYLSKIMIDMPAADGSKYEIANADGSAWDSYNGNQNIDQNIGGKAGVYTLATGDYYLVEKATGIKSPFSVVDPVVGKQQSVKLPVVETIGTAADLKALFDEAFKNGNDQPVVVKLSNDIDVANSWTTFPIPNMSASVTIDGDGHTISRLNAPLVTGLWGGYGSLIFENLTIASANIVGFDANIDANGSVSASGAFVGYSDAGTEIIFNKCHLLNSMVSGSDKTSDGNATYTGGFIGYASTPVKFTNCSVSGTTISGHKSTGALIGHQGAKDLTISSCSIVDSTIKGLRDGGDLDTDIGIVFGRTSGSFTVTMKGITQSGNTLVKGFGTANETTEENSTQLYGSLKGYTLVTE